MAILYLIRSLFFKKKPEYRAVDVFLKIYTLQKHKYKSEAESLVCMYTIHDYLTLFAKDNLQIDYFVKKLMNDQKYMGTFIADNDSDIKKITRSIITRVSFPMLFEVGFGQVDENYMKRELKLWEYIDKAYDKIILKHNK